MNFPPAMKNFKPFDECGGCQKPRSHLGGARFKRCGGCRITVYCSTACQTAHWQNGHKQVCKKATKDLAEIQEAEGSKFVADLKKWELGSQVLLHSLVFTMLQEAALRESRPGAPIKPTELLKHGFCVVLNVDYTPGSRPPFRIRDDYSLVSFDVLEAQAHDTIGTGGDTFKELVKTMRGAVSELEGGGNDVVLHVVMQIGLNMKAVKFMGPRGIVNRPDPNLCAGVVAERVKEINDRF